MKFLCIPCDVRMNLLTTNAPDRGSMTIVFHCPNCAHQIAMMTNPQETEVVGSLGVKIGGKSLDESGPSSNGKGNCPFTGASAKTMSEKIAVVEEGGAIPWTAQALGRLQNIPEYVRPMAKKGIEKMALERDYAEIDEEVLNQARDFFGM